jgi:hypothetical protein
MVHKLELPEYPELQVRLAEQDLRLLLLPAVVVVVQVQIILQPLVADQVVAVVVTEQ